ncbi:MAG TPA: hypothetical protein VHB46_11095 [Burkholderiales bacterium]|nr:hypothetical protein [Burkholderiales bacterium]
MPTIGVIDDRADARETLCRNINLEIEEEHNWSAIEHGPLAKIEDYPGWLHDAGIAVLVVDERLQEQADAGEEPATYSGHELVSYLRMRLPTLPLFMVTSHADEDDLEGAEADAEDVVQREDFNKNPKIYVQRMLRAGRKFTEEFLAELAQLSEIAERTAMGSATDADREKEKAIREKLTLASPDGLSLSRQTWLGELDKEIKELGALSDKIHDRLSRKN